MPSRWKNRLEEEYLYPYGRIECPLQAAAEPTTPVQRSFQHALGQGDLAAVRQAVWDGASTTTVVPLAPDDDRYPSTPVGVAWSRGWDDMARFFLAREPKPARPALRRDFALWIMDMCRGDQEDSWAVRHVQLVVDYFGPEILSNGNHLDAFIPLHYACYHCHWPMIQYLVSRQQSCASVEDTHGAATYLRLTPWHVLRHNTQRPADVGRVLAWILQERRHHVGGRLLLTQPDAKGRTVLEAMLQHADTNIRNFCVTSLVTNSK